MYEHVRVRCSVPGVTLGPVGSPRRPPVERGLEVTAGRMEGLARSRGRGSCLSVALAERRDARQDPPAPPRCVDHSTHFEALRAYCPIVRHLFCGLAGGDRRLRGAPTGRHVARRGHHRLGDRVRSVRRCLFRFALLLHAVRGCRRGLSPVRRAPRGLLGGRHPATDRDAGRAAGPPRLDPKRTPRARRLDRRRHDGWRDPIGAARQAGHRQLAQEPHPVRVPGRNGHRCADEAEFRPGAHAPAGRDCAARRGAGPSSRHARQRGQSAPRVHRHRHSRCRRIGWLLSWQRGRVGQECGGNGHGEPPRLYGGQRFDGARHAAGDRLAHP
jgi:hypothetical protein